MMSESTRSRRFVLAVTIGAVLLAGNARADENPFFVGDQLTSTSYSGWAGTISSTGEAVMFEGGMGGLMEITWFEDRDQPCHLGTRLRTLTEGTEVYTNGEFNHCVGNPGNRKEVGFWDNPRYFVRGIAVCSSKSGNKERMKGIKLYAAKAWLTKPEVEELTTAVMEDHTNCGTWNAAVFCPADHAATSLVIHRSDRSITWLGLKCRPIQYH
jgi:hypothetical protein